VLNFARAAIALRRASPALREGAIKFLEAPEGVLAFTRTSGNETLLCVFNLAQNDQTLPDSLNSFGAIRLVIGSMDSAATDILPSLSGFIAAPK
jgi:alpha-glucosidase